MFYKHQQSRDRISHPKFPFALDLEMENWVRGSLGYADFEISEAHLLFLLNLVLQNRFGLCPPPLSNPIFKAVNKGLLGGSVG